MVMGREGGEMETQGKTIKDNGRWDVGGVYGMDSGPTPGDT